jgi:hypothetical protein
MGSDETGQEPHGGAGIRGIHRSFGADQAAQAAAGDLDGPRRRSLDGDAQGAKTGYRGSAIGAGGIPGNPGPAVGNGAEQGVPV